MDIPHRLVPRVIVAAIAGITALFSQAAAPAQSYPDRPVRVIVAFAAGGFADGVTRRVTQHMSEGLRQTFVVDNRGGAGGNIAAQLTAEATPDGYTLLTHTAASAVNVTLYKNLRFDLLRDLTPVANTVSAPGVFSVLASHPARDLKDFIERSRGKRISYATAGVGTSSHIAGDYLLRVLAKLDAVHVPFKGGGPAVIAVLGNQVEMLNGSSVANPHIKAGRLKGLAVASLKRVESLPDVQTVAEAGFPGFEERSWVGFYAPAKTPPAVVNLLNKEINRVLQLPEVSSYFKGQAQDIHLGSAAEFAQYVRREVANWSKMVSTTGVKVE